MASLVRQLQSKAAVATEIAAKHGSSYYKQLLENNKQYIQSEPTVQKCQELSKQLFYTRLASIPGRYEAFWKEVDYIKQRLLARNDLKLEEVQNYAVHDAVRDVLDYLYEDLPGVIHRENQAWTGG